MKISADRGGKITVILSVEDIRSIGIPLKEMNSRDPDIRLIMNALYRAATEKIGIAAPSRELLIEAHPTLGGGGILYFTPLIAKNSFDIRLKKAETPLLLYEFSDGSALLDLISFLYSCDETQNLKSSLFHQGNVFFLAIENDNGSEKLRAAKEFCDNFYTLSSEKKRKLGNKLAGDNAIYEIGHKIKGL